MAIHHHPKTKVTHHLGILQRLTPLLGILRRLTPLLGIPGDLIVSRVDVQGKSYWMACICEQQRCICELLGIVSWYVANLILNINDYYGYIGKTRLQPVWTMCAILLQFV